MKVSLPETSRSPDACPRNGCRRNLRTNRSGSRSVRKAVVAAGVTLIVATGITITNWRSRTAPPIADSPPRTGPAVEIRIGPYTVAVPRQFVLLADREPDPNRSTMLVLMTAEQAGLPAPAHPKIAPKSQVAFRFELGRSDADRLQTLASDYKKGQPIREAGYLVYPASGGFSLFIAPQGVRPIYLMCQRTNFRFPTWPDLCDVDVSVRSMPGQPDLVITYPTRSDYFDSLAQFNANLIRMAQSFVQTPRTNEEIWPQPPPSVHRS